VRRDGRIVSVAGVHVLSRQHRVAALGNVATNAAFRGRGLGRVVCAALCKDLVAIADPVGLNVLSSNAAAISLYEQLGFVRIAQYEEAMIEAR
jgi:predicted GNAT family acetyltransferase